MNPGRTVRPPRSTIWVSAPFKARISSSLPVAMILSPDIARASTEFRPKSMVTILPLKKNLIRLRHVYLQMMYGATILYDIA